MSKAWGRRLISCSINGALVVGSLVVAFLLAEASLRLLDFSHPVLWTYDDITGSRLYAGAEGWFRDEGEAYIRINSAGLRDREHIKAKPANTVRIVVLGDSMTEALQVPLESTFSFLLEQQLKTCKSFVGKNVEVLNFGVSGYGTAQELLTFRHRATEYSPDLTILAFYAGNDVRNNSKALEPDQVRPFFTLQDKKLVAENAFLSSSAYVSFKANFDERRKFFRLRVFQFARQVVSIAKHWGEAQASDSLAATLNAGSDDTVFVPPPTKEWRDAWDVTKHLVVAIRNEVAATGGRFMVVSIPIAVQVDPDASVRDRFMHLHGIDNLWYPDVEMNELARTEGIDVITLGHAFLAIAEKNRVYLHGFQNTHLGIGHLNENGHRAVGEALARHICPI